MREVLTDLRNSGVKLFLATNSHIEYMELIMETTLGEDWKQFFDLLCSFSCKPSLFNNTKPFYEVDLNDPKLRGAEITSVD
mmetsp:Transcript_48473/g.65821  ORF Transcript_48473/g.65821 Transcript_48473/m.65821 type:complete len:81 (+) Transcript_48473:510-752(+)